jgi:hypothetical protein
MLHAAVAVFATLAAQLLSWTALASQLSCCLLGVWVPAAPTLYRGCFISANGHTPATLRVNLQHKSKTQDARCVRQLAVILLYELLYIRMS